MIEEDYVSHETAKLLKEKGFDVDECEVHYDPEDHTQYDITLQMAMKWLREEHNVHINLDIHWLYFANSKGWMYVIERILENGVEYIDSKGDEDDKTFYSTYEEAAEAAIKYCLEKLT